MLHLSVLTPALVCACYDLISFPRMQTSVGQKYPSLQLQLQPQILYNPIYITHKLWSVQISLRIENFQPGVWVG